MPLQLIAVQGLRRYGFSDLADRITMKFLSLVRDEYLKSGTIVENTMSFAGQSKSVVTFALAIGQMKQASGGRMLYSSRCWTS